MPVEIMLLPRWFPFHLDKVSYWSRTVIVPLLVLMAQAAAGAQPKRGSTCASCSSTPPEQVTDWYNYNRKGAWACVLPRRRPRAAARAGPVPEEARASGAIDEAVAWVTERLNGEDGLGAIYPGDGQLR